MLEIIISNIAGLLGVMLTLLTLYKLLKTGKIVDATHQIVNSQRDAMIQVMANMQLKIDDLTKQIADHKRNE